MEQCSYCKRYGHSSFDCREKVRDREATQLKDHLATEATRARRAQEHARDDQVATNEKLVAEWRELTRIKNAEREEKRRDKKHHAVAASRLHHLKVRVSPLRQGTGLDRSRAWLEWRLLDVETSELGPNDFDASQRAEFTEFLGTVRQEAAAAETALGAANAQSLGNWIRLRGERSRTMDALLRGLDALDPAGEDAENAPMSSAAAKSQLALVVAEMLAYEAQKPPSLPSNVPLLGRRDRDFRERVIAELPGGGPSNEAAQRAWNFLVQGHPPPQPATRSPSPTAAWTTAKWVVGIGLIFAGGALYSLEGTWADRLTVGGVAYSPVGGLGLALVLSLSLLSRRARQGEVADARRFEQECDPYARAVVAFEAWGDWVENRLRVGRQRAGTLKRLAKNFRTAELFDADPHRGQMLDQLEELRPDLVKLVTEISMLDVRNENANESDNE